LDAYEYYAPLELQQFFFAIARLGLEPLPVTAN
jgi:hypothetical protein